MHDRPSDKPPSMYTRVFGGINSSQANIDKLMEDYHDDTEGSSAVQKAVSPNKRITHHANPSITSNATSATKESGVYKFGRSLAAAFNPMGFFQRMQKNWEESKEEVTREMVLEHQQMLEERRIKAEATYADLKRAGQLGTQGTQSFAQGSKVYTPGYQPEDAAQNSQRDSGVDMGEVRRSHDVHDGTDKTSSSEQPPPRKSFSKHFRSPSLTNLKKIRSESNISRSASPEKQKELPSLPENRQVRKAPSKKDLAKQQKLSKRVSDLEGKLEAARHELRVALGESPPPLPEASQAFKVANAPAIAPQQPSSARSRSVSPVKRQPFVPGNLPSLPSERLLFPNQLDDEREDAQSGDEFEGDGGNSPQHNQSATPFYKQVDKAKSTVDLNEQHEGNGSTDPLIPARDPPPVPAKGKVSKKRKSADKADLTYKFETDSDDDEHLDEAKSRKARKKGKLTAPANTETVTKTATKLTKTPTSTSVTRTTTTAIPVKSSTSKPTAFATPAHPNGSNRLQKKQSGRFQRRSATAFDNGDNDVVQLVPDGQRVPPLPQLPPGVNGKSNGSHNGSQKENQKQGIMPRGDSFEWPPDVF
jgi:hypothetical protein